MFIEHLLLDTALLNVIHVIPTPPKHVTWSCLLVKNEKIKVSDFKLLEVIQTAKDMLGFEVNPI